MRRSLARLARLLIGDKKAEVAPLFAVHLSLEKSGRVELRPDVQVTPVYGFSGYKIRFQDTLTPSCNGSVRNRCALRGTFYDGH